MIGIGKIPAIFPAKSGRDGAGIRGFRGLVPPRFGRENSRDFPDVALAPWRWTNDR
jgi:hypothetical protein